MTFDRREITDPPRRIHLAHETVAHLGDEAGAEFVLPVLEGTCRGNLKAIQKWTVDGHVITGEVVDIDVNPASRQADGGALNYHCLPSHLGFDDRESLGERMIGEFRGRIRP